MSSNTRIARPWVPQDQIAVARVHEKVPDRHRGYTRGER